MNHLQDGKISFTMKDALTRNHIEEQNMKTNIKSLQCVNNKEIHVLKHKQAYYQKRQEEFKKLSLENTDGKSVDSPPQSPNFTLSRKQAHNYQYRKISEPTSFQSISKLNTGNDGYRSRSLSAVCLPCSPSIEVSDYDSGSVEKPVKLPPIVPSATNLTMQRKTNDLSLRVTNFLKRPSSASKVHSEFGSSVGTPSDKAPGSKSAPSSPQLTGNAFLLPGNQLPKSTTRRRTKSATIHPRKGFLKREESIDYDALAESLDKIKFCKYLRGSELESRLSDQRETLPQELLPGSLITGHTKIVTDTH